MTLLASAFLYTSTSAFATPPVSGSQKDKDFCGKVADCATKIVWSHRWVQCLIPAQTRIQISDDVYKTVPTEVPAWSPGGPCVCPENFTLVRVNRVSQVTKSDDKVHKHAELSGVCVPLKTEPNAKIIADALNAQRTFMTETRTNLAANRTEVIGMIDTSAGKIALNADDIDRLKDEANGFSSFMNGACQAPNLPLNWQEICDSVPELNRLVSGLVQREKPFWLAAHGEAVRFSGRTYIGVGLDAALRTGRLGSEDSRWRLELGGRVGVGTAEKMDPKGSGDSDLMYNTTLYAGPTVDLDDDGVVSLHPRGFIEAGWRVNSDESVSRRYGAELALSFCPNSTKDDPVSFCVMPRFSVGHGRSVFNLAPESDSPAPKDAQSSVTAAGGVSLGGRF